MLQMQIVKISGCANYPTYTQIEEDSLGNIQCGYNNHYSLGDGSNTDRSGL